MSAHAISEQLKKADDVLDREDYQNSTTKLGESLFKVFGNDADGRISSQIRNLQQMAVSASRLADVEDFVKNQMGRKTGAYKQWRQIGDDILNELKKLRAVAEEIASDQGSQHRLRLHLARGWMHSVVGAYLYQKAVTEMGQDHG